MKKIFLIILSISLSFTGCDISDFGDTNENVNGPLDGNTASLISGAMTRFSTRQGRPYRITPTLNVQYFMQLVYNDEMLYADYAGSWWQYYVQTLSNLEEVITILSDEEAGSDPAIIANGSIENQMAVAMIFKSVIFKHVTDLFGDVPYSDALNVETLTPTYDRQEDIYAGMIADVQAARDMIDVDADGATGDVIYGGDMAMWIKFANSFLMKMALQLSEATTSIDVEGTFTNALNHPGGVIETLEDEAWFTFDTQNGFNNPWNWMRPADYGVTEELISSLKGYGENSVTSNTTFDNRVLVMQNDTSQAGLPYGYLDYGDGIKADVATILIDPGTPLPLLTAGYTWLNRAEAAARGWTAENVTECLSNGIMASYASMQAIYDPADALGIGDGATYALARVADASSVGELQVIGEEKWVALYPLGYDAWSEWRRTEIPALQPAPDAINNGEIPRRYNYPSDETTLNTANYQTGVSGLSPATDNNTSRVWWNQ